MILITGVAGYIGAITCANFLKAKEKIIGIDNISTSSLKSIEYLKSFDDFTFYESDYANEVALNEICKNHKISCVVHFAANTQVYESTQNPLKYYENNISKMISLLKICDKFNINNFIFSSSAAVYGEPENSDLIDESSPKNPINPYGMSKLMGEFILNDFANAKKDFKFIALRYFNVAGASLIAPLGQFMPSSLLIKIAAECASGKRDKMYLYGSDYNTPDGSCVRDFIHVDDLAIAHIKAYKYLLEQRKSDVFNVGYSQGTSVKQVISMMKKVSKNDFKVELASRRAGDPSYLVASNEKIKNLMNWDFKNNDLELICKSAYEWEKSL